QLVRRRRVERLGERQVEAVLRQLHRVNLERHHAGVDEALQPVGAAAGRAPAAVGHADVEAAVRPEAQAVDAAGGTAPGPEAPPREAAVALLQVDTHHHRFVLVADEHLPGERAELAAGGVPDRLADRLAHAAVGEPDARRCRLRHAGLVRLALLAVVEHVAGVRLLERVGERRLLDPAQAGGVAVVFAFLDVVQFVGRDPLALVVGVEQVAVRADLYALGRAPTAPLVDPLPL